VLGCCWWRGGGREFSRYGCAFAPAFGRAEPTLATIQLARRWGMLSSTNSELAFRLAKEKRKLLMNVIAATISLLLGALGIFLSATGEHRPYRRRYMLGFAALGLIGLISTCLVEHNNAIEKRTAAAESTQNQARLSGELAALDNENAFLKGKLDTIGTMLATIAAKPSTDPILAKVLVASVKNATTTGFSSVKPEGTLLERIGSTYGEGERLRDVCVSEGAAGPGDKREFEDWERDSVAELTEQYGLDVLRKSPMYFYYEQVPAGSQMSQYCWTFLNKVNGFEEILRSNNWVKQ
jgi:hypothetical protein